MYTRQEFSIYSITIKKPSGNNPNLLAYAMLTFQGNRGSYFTISGITIWISKIDGKRNVEFPKNKGFKYVLLEKKFGEDLKKEILRSYSRAKLDKKLD